MENLDSVLPPLRVDNQLKELIQKEATKHGMNESEFRRKILLEYFANSPKIKGVLNLDLNTKDKQRIRVNIPKDLMNELSSTGYLSVYNSFNSLIQSLIITSITDIQLLTDEDTKAFITLIRELQALGRNFNQLVKAVNYQIKYKDKAELTTLKNIHAAVLIIEEKIINIESIAKAITRAKGA